MAVSANVRCVQLVLTLGLLLIAGCDPAAYNRTYMAHYPDGLTLVAFGRGPYRAIYWKRSESQPSCPLVLHLPATPHQLGGDYTADDLVRVDELAHKGWSRTADPSTYSCQGVEKDKHSYLVRVHVVDDRLERVLFDAQGPTSARVTLYGERLAFPLVRDSVHRWLGRPVREEVVDPFRQWMEDLWEPPALDEEPGKVAE